MKKVLFTLCALLIIGSLQARSVAVANLASALLSIGKDFKQEEAVGIQSETTQEILMKIKETGGSIQDSQCSPYLKWFNDNDQANGKKYAAQVDATMQPFEEKVKHFKSDQTIKDEEEPSAYKNGLLSKFKQAIVFLYKPRDIAVSKSTGRLIYKDVSGAYKILGLGFDTLSKLLKNQKVHFKDLVTDPKNKADADRFEGDLLLNCILVPEFIHDVKKFSEDQGYPEYADNLIVKMYEVSIGYLQKILARLNEQIVKKQKLTDDEKNDLDFATGFYTKIKSILDEATQKSGPYSPLKEDDSVRIRAAKFVKEINDLSSYLIALLCWQGQNLKSIGFDYDVFIPLVADEKNRLLCAYKEEIKGLDQIIDAPWNYHITYKEGDKDFRFRSFIVKASINDKGRPIEADKNKWKLVDTSQPYYRRFYVVFQEIAQMVTEYNNYVGVKGNKFKAMQEARITLLLSKLNDFVYYLKVACGKATCSTSLCPSCFRWDLNGSRGDSGFGFKLANGSFDEEKITQVSKEVDNALVEAEKFLTKIGGKNPPAHIVKALKQAKAVQLFKASGCDAVKNWSEV